jgi:hypothetical protein
VSWKSIHENRAEIITPMLVLRDEGLLEDEPIPKLEIASLNPVF